MTAHKDGRRLADSMPMIEMRALRKSFVSADKRTRVHAVDGLDIVVQHGQTFGLLGADGAGKTTTLRLLNGLWLPDSGAARVAGYDTVTDFHRIHEIAGYMPQQFALYGDLSALENLVFFAEAYGLTRAEKQARIPGLLRFARLEQFKDRRADKLSGGMKKKLALACMLIHEPDVVFLDEPTLGVDPVSRREFWNLLSELRVKRGMTIFVCTPYMDEAERCHRVGLLYEGRLIAQGTPAEIKATVPGELIELQPLDFHRARNGLMQVEGVLEVQTYGELLHVFVDNAQHRMPGIRATLEAQGIAVGDMRAIEPSMEEAFISLMRQPARAGSGQEASE